MDKNKENELGETTQTGNSSTGTTPKTGETGTTPKIGETGTAPVGTSGTTITGQEIKKDKKKTVEVNSDVLRKLVDTVESQKQDIKDLQESADLGRLSRIQEARKSGKLVKTAKISVYNGKIVKGWIKDKDDVYFDEAGRLHEDQKVCLFLDNGDDKKAIKTEPISYREFARVLTKIEGEVIKESKDNDGQTFFTVQLDDGREIELPIQFIN